jgi:lipopolysaccharide export system protein LptA
MKALLVPLLALAGVAHAQTSPATGSERPEINAQHLTHAGPLVRGTGGVEIRIGRLVLHGDQGSVNTETGEVDVRGRAEIVLPARVDHTLFRYDHGALVTDKTVYLSADHLHVKHMMLEGSGNIRVRTADDSLTADGVEMFLTSADGRVSGNVLTARSGGPGVREWVPEIIKQ